MKKLIIGRAPDCDIVINDQYVSRRHCQLTIYGNGRCSVSDLNSKTGTFVNGNKIVNEQFLNGNDQLKVGLTNVPWHRYVSSLPQDNKVNKLDLDKTKRVVLDQKKKLKDKLPLILGSIGGVAIILGALYYFFLFHPMKTFEKSYGDYEDVMVSGLSQTADDGYVYGGIAFDDNENYVTFLAKIDKEGNKVWINNLFKVEDKDEIVVISSISNTSDNGFILVVRTENDDNYITKIIKTNKVGDILWEKSINNNEGNIIANAIIETNDGGYILTGKKYIEYNSYKLWVYKMDIDGNKEWEKKLGGNESDEGVKIKQLENNDYIIVGTTESKGKGSSDIWVIYLDNEGSKVWNKTYGGRNSDYGRDIIQVENGFIVLGKTYTKSKGSSDIWLIKIGEDGKKEWSKKYGGKSEEKPIGILNDDNGYIIGAITRSEGEGGMDGWVIKTNTEGEKEWDRTFGGEERDYFTDMIRTSDGGIAFVGITESKDEGEKDVWVLKLNNEGKLKKK